MSSLNGLFKELYDDKMEELVPMSQPKKFKPGDKVRFIRKYTDFPIGTITVIKEALSSGMYNIESEMPTGTFFVSDFELVEEKQEEPVKVFKSVAEEWGF